MNCFVSYLLVVCSVAVTGAAYAANPPDDAVVYIQVFYQKDNQAVVVDEGSGFVVNSRGWVITAKHLLEAQVPKEYEKRYRGAVTSITNITHEMFAVPGTVVTADAGLLMFSPQLSQKWAFLKVIPDKILTKATKIEGLGFPGQELSDRPGAITGLLGDDGTLEVNAGFTFGMSGGPVLLEGTRCVIATIFGGKPNRFDYVMPISYSKPLLEEALAEIIAPENEASGCSKETIPGYYDYNHPLVNIKVVGGMAFIKVSFNVPSPPVLAPADWANIIRIYSFRLVGDQHLNQSTYRPVTGQWSAGDVATFDATVPSDYLNDADRQMHFCVGTQAVCTPSPDLLHYPDAKRQ